MSFPAIVAFSQKYRSYGICGAFGLSDHGFCEEVDMAQRCTKRREGTSVEGKTELWVGEIQERRKISELDGKKRRVESPVRYKSEREAQLNGDRRRVRISEAISLS